MNNEKPSRAELMQIVGDGLLTGLCGHYPDHEMWQECDEVRSLSPELRRIAHEVWDRYEPIVKRAEMASVLATPE